jgi:WD40 repeat protein
MWQDFSSGLSAALVSAAIVLMQPAVAVSQIMDEQAIAAIARASTVVINGQNPGSGVIVSRDGNTYYVLTAKHVVASEDEYEIVTSDGTKYPLNYSSVKKLPEIDLALIQFTSDKNYLVAQVGDSDKVTEGNSVYISGWPHPGRAITQRIFQLTSGKISGRPLELLEDGYGLVYTNITRSGMSGGSILDANGVVIGIHGRADGEPIINPETGEDIAIKSGFNLGITINNFVEFAAQEGIKLHYFGYNFFENKANIFTGHSTGVVSLKISLDNRTLISGSFDGTIKVWDLQTEQLLKTLTHSGGIKDLAIAPDGQMLASASFEGTIKLWNLKTGKELRTINAHSGYVFSVSFSPDGKILASSSNDDSVKIWNLKTGQLLQTMKLDGFDRYGVYYTGFSPDSKTVVGADRNGQISFWNVKTGELINIIQYDCPWSTLPFVISPIGQKIVGTCPEEDTIKTWDISTGQLLYTIIGNDPYALEINPYGQLLAGVDVRGNISIWNLQTGQLLRHFQFPEPGRYELPLSSVAFSADGQTLVVGNGGSANLNDTAGLIGIFRRARY